MTKMCNLGICFLPLCKHALPVIFFQQSFKLLVVHVLFLSQYLVGCLLFRQIFFSSLQFYQCIFFLSLKKIIVWFFSFFHFFMIYYRLDKMKCWFGVTTGNMYVISFSYEFARGLFTTCILAANVLIFWIGIINLHIWLTGADFWTMEMCKWRTLLFWLKTRLNIGSIKKPERTING